MIHDMMQFRIRIWSNNLRMYIPLYIRPFCREKAVDVIWAKDSMCGMMMVEFILPLNPIGFLIAFSDDSADFLRQWL